MKGFSCLSQKTKSSAGRTELAGFLLLFVFVLTHAAAAIGNAVKLTLSKQVLPQLHPGVSPSVPFSPFMFVSDSRVFQLYLLDARSQYFVFSGLEVVLIELFQMQITVCSVG